ncbi:MAG: septum formation initiator family protein, partial [Elusimicrobiota bacterium]|nr:septum formation initiator family protein [Elusimicrobiota bacterium]
MKGTRSKFIYIVGAFIVLIILFSASNFRNILKLREDQRYYRKKIASLEKQNAELQQQLEWIKTQEDYVKFIARKRMGLVAP